MSEFVIKKDHWTLIVVFVGILIAAGIVSAVGPLIENIGAADTTNPSGSGTDGADTGTGVDASKIEDEDKVNVFPIVKVPIEDYNYGNDFNDVLSIPKKLNTMYLTDRTPGDPNGLDRGIIVFEKEAFMKGIQFTFYENTLGTNRKSVKIIDKKADHLDKEILILTKFPATKKDFAYTDEGKYIFVMLSQQ